MDNKIDPQAGHIPPRLIERETLIHQLQPGEWGYTLQHALTFKDHPRKTYEYLVPYLHTGFPASPSLEATYQLKVLRTGRHVHDYSIEIVPRPREHLGGEFAWYVIENPQTEFYLNSDPQNIVELLKNKISIDQSLEYQGRTFRRAHGRVVLLPGRSFSQEPTFD